ncbi:MAG: alpha/beta hydrolase [Caldilineaceae bacterium]
MIDLHKVQSLAKSYWQLNRLAAKAGVATLSHRLRGTSLASWSLPFESTFRMMAMGSPQAELTDVWQIRNPVNNMARLPQLIRSKRTPVVAGLAPGEWVEVPNSSQDRIVLFLHGGGYVFGSPYTHRLITATVAKSAGARVLAIDYRLAPEYPFPAALEDAWAAYWWLLEQKIKGSQIVVMGDSAGGGLSVALMLALRDAGLPLPAGAALLSPWLDLSLQSKSIQKNEATDYINEIGLRAAASMYANGFDPHNPLISPMFADLRGLPPILIQSGTAETLHDDAIRFAERAREANVSVTLEKWEEMVHVFQLWYRIEPKARQAVEHLGQFVHQQVDCKEEHQNHDLHVTIRRAVSEI